MTDRVDDVCRDLATQLASKVAEVESRDIENEHLQAYAEAFREVLDAAAREAWTEERRESDERALTERAARLGDVLLVNANLASFCSAIIDQNKALDAKLDRMAEMVAAQIVDLAPVPGVNAQEWIKQADWLKRVWFLHYVKHGQLGPRKDGADGSGS